MRGSSNMAKKTQNIPQTLHLYWGKDKPLSWLRWLTVKSFAMLNPKWKVIVWYPETPGRLPEWSTQEHSHYSWTGPDWFARLAEAGPNVEVRPADLTGFDHLAEVHRSDLLRWRLLYEQGGFWSDIDIVYFRPMEAAGLEMDADALLCWGETEDLRHWQAIGFLAGKPGNGLFREMYGLGLTIAKVPHLGYQVLGSDLLLKFAIPGEFKSCGSRIAQIPQRVVYPFRSVASQKTALWKSWAALDVRNITVGVHWFAAQRESCIKEGAWTGLGAVYGDGGVNWAIGQLGLTETKKKSPVPKYSIIMPYIDRPELLHNTMLSYHHWYGRRNDWEVVLIQDSKCSDPAALETVVSHWVSKGMAINLLCLDADKSYNPAPLFDLGAKNARGAYFVITNPEQFHDTDILAGLDQEFADRKRKYVVCACKSRSRPAGGKAIKMTAFRHLREASDKWFQHSVHRPSMYHFCSALSREDYFISGGFDPAYAEGFCFDDDDFRDSVLKSGVEPVQRDDLVTSHQWHGSCQVPDKMDRWNRNKDLYESKHGKYKITAEADIVPADRPASKPPSPPEVTVVCVLRSGGPFTPEYVSCLYNMVGRNVTMGYDFVCLTDLPVDIDGCTAIPLADDLPGWWSKMELFRPGLFRTDRVVYLDLDTLIMGNIDRLLSLHGGFYGLRPWNSVNRRSGQLGSGMMAWHNGSFNFIYEGFNLAKVSPRDGDQAFISAALSARGKNWLALQDHIQGIRSYKRECRGGPPIDTRVVCFHGRPRVHECQDKWVQEVWK